jgi:hypothetical protein
VLPKLAADLHLLAAAELDEFGQLANGGSSLLHQEEA